MRLTQINENTKYHARTNTHLAKLLTPAVEHLGKIFADDGFELRIVGGAVRDAIIGKDPKDIDLASPATPDEMVDIAKRHNIHMIPTGLQHGTLTYHIDGEDYEVTTLRVDTNHDGRHADVAWTRSFKDDAARRDLTFNALSMDMHGQVYDYFNGIDDLLDGHVKFVGNPVGRIEEDFLRILRYFRFFGRQSSPRVDKSTIENIKKTAYGLEKISGERVWMEMSKILTGNHIVTILELMDMVDIERHIGMPIRNIHVVEATQSFTSNPITLLTVMLNSEHEFNNIVERWKLSNPEKELGYFIIKYRSTQLNEVIVRNMIINGAKAEMLAEVAAVQNNSSLIPKIKSMVVPDFPIQGKDLITLGIKPGPEMGEILRKLKAMWVASLDSAPKTKEELLSLL